MSQYWYFAATLPALQPGAPAPFSSERFLELCREQLSDQDYEAVESARLSSASTDQPTGPLQAAPASFLASYRSWERSLGNELVRARAKRLGRSADPWLRVSGENDRAPASARAALDAATPLEGELALERERWAFIDELRGVGTFGLDAILAYRLQLQILERLTGFAVDIGEAKYREIYAAILGGANANE
ncbi:MAG: DUF2764 family protein [Spirochaetaceae bacterium]|nr:DUF2764 family protein [Spirochaetaceae bacterium]